MTNVTDIHEFAAKKRQEKHAAKVLQSFAEHFTPEAIELRFNLLLANLIEEHRHLGKDRILNVLAGAAIVVKTFEDEKK